MFGLAILYKWTSAAAVVVAAVVVEPHLSLFNGVTLRWLSRYPSDAHFISNSDLPRKKRNGTKVMIFNSINCSNSFFSLLDSLNLFDAKTILM